MAGRRERKRQRQHGTTELELMPMLNVFIAIIPLLLLSAAFVPVSVIQTSLPPGESGGAVVAAEAAAPIRLGIVIRPTAYVIQVSGESERVIPRSAHPTPGTADPTRAQLLETLRAVAQAHT